MSMFDGFELGIDLFWSIMTAEPLITGTLVLLFIGSYLVVFIRDVLWDRKLKKSGILQIDAMTGREFEEYLRVLFFERGYRVRLTKKTGDYGVDLILSSKNRKIIVQAKRYKKNVGIKAVQEISAAKNHYQADECWVVTNSHFTDPARNLAKSNQVRLVDRPLLMKWMLEMKKNDKKGPVGRSSISQKENGGSGS
jgi:restriction system protein